MRRHGCGAGAIGELDFLVLPKIAGRFHCNKIDFVTADMVRMSLPANNGAAVSAQRLMCVRYSSSVMWPLPTSSMSGSFQWPGAAYGARWLWLNPMVDMLSQLSLMSPVVRHRFPLTSG